MNNKSISGEFSTRWMTYFMQMAQLTATLSKDPRTKVGCVIINPTNKSILSTGFNGFPRMIEDKEEMYLDRPTKLKYVVHAEANAICNAAYNNVGLKGSVLFVTLPPCIECSKLIIQAGISSVYAVKEKNISNLVSEDWRAMLQESQDLLSQAGVTCNFIDLL